MVVDTKTTGRGTPICPDCLGKKKSSRWERCQSCAAKNRWSNPHNRKTNGLSIKNSLTYQASMHSEAYRKKRSGPNHIYWRGGIHTPYGPEFNNHLRSIIRKRDDYLCQNPACYVQENGRLHSVHHIDYNRKNGHPANLITLCAKCHTKTTTGDREYWIEFYHTLQDMRGIKTGIEKSIP